MKGSWKKKQQLRVALAVFFMLILLPCAARGETLISRADALTLSGVNAYGSPQKAPVLFLHDAHTTAPIDEMKRCEACHAVDQRSGLLYFRFAPTVGGAGKILAGTALMDAWHNGCGGCHAKLRQSGQAAGPIRTAVCASCHRLNPAAVWGGSSGAMSVAAHSAHEVSPLIQGRDGADNCGVCHHAVKNAGERTALWEAGAEIVCAECHGAGEKGRETGEAPALREASHRACLSCHSRTQQKAQAPLACASCHGRS